MLGGVPGVPPAEVVILGSGVVATYATRGFLGLGAHVTVIGKELGELQKMIELFPSVATMMSTKRNIEKATAYADVLVGAVLVTGQRAPILATSSAGRAFGWIRAHAVQKSSRVATGGVTGWPGIGCSSVMSSVPKPRLFSAQTHSSSWSTPFSC